MIECGITPLDFLLAVMRDNHQDFRVHLDAAKTTAPYCHARLRFGRIEGRKHRGSRTADDSNAGYYGSKRG